MIFLFAIYAKLFGVQGAKFARWGFERWFIFFTAATELASIIGLYFPAWQIPAWMLLMTILVGALITLLRNQEEGNKFILPLTTLGLLVTYFLILKLY
ncbi:MAG: DoxX family protein [Bacteroidia bacterium]